jgi:hypothetical protein
MYPALDSMETKKPTLREIVESVKPIHSMKLKDRQSDKKELYTLFAESKAEFIKEYGKNPFEGVTITPTYCIIPADCISMDISPSLSYEMNYSESDYGETTTRTVFTPGFFGVRKL